MMDKVINFCIMLLFCLSVFAFVLSVTTKGRDRVEINIDDRNIMERIDRLENSIKEINRIIEERKLK